MSQGSIIKREGKTGLVSWLLKYDAGAHPVTGKRIQKYKTVKGTKKDAATELRKLLAHVDEGTHVDQNKMTVSAWIATWLKDYAEPTVSAKTLERYSQLLNLHILPYLGGVPVQKLTAVQIQSVYSTLRSEGKKPKQEGGACSGLSEQTILHVHRAFSQALREAERTRLIARNPAEDVKAPRPAGQILANADGERTETINALDREALAQLLAGFSGHQLKELVMIAAATGMRRGEILGLRWNDIDFEKRQIRVERSAEYTKLKGTRLKTTKTKSSRRTIGIDAGMVSILKRFHLARIEAAFAKGVRLPADALLFARGPESPGIPRQPSHVSKEFSRQAKSLGFDSLRLHDLRHTHATLLLMAGVPVNAVAQRLGHASPVMTLSVYGHVLKRSEDQAVEVAASITSSVLGL